MKDLIAYTLGVMLSVFFRSNLAVLAPELSVDLRATASDLGTLSGVWFFAFALAQVPIGVALDRWGPRLTVAVGLSIGVVGACLFAAAPSISAAIVAQILLGLACAPLFMATVVYIARNWTRDRFLWVMGNVLAVSNLGAILAATPLAAMSEWLGWRGAMWGMAAATFLLALYVVFAVTKDARAPAQESIRQAVRGIAVVLSVRELWPLLPFVLVCSGVIMAVRALWGGPYLSDVFGLGPVGRGNVLVGMVLAASAMSYAVGRLERLVGSPRPLVIAVSAITAVALIVLAVWPSASLTLSVVLMIVIGLFGAAYGLAIGHGRLFFPVGKEGRGATLLNFFNFIGAAVMQVATGAVIEHAVEAGLSRAHAYGLMFGFLVVLLVLSLIPYWKSKTSVSG
ncbi:MAG: MFS transporter [Alphaproteobacteria bacterium]